MADMYTVAFQAYDTGQSVQFEYQERAEHFADRLALIGFGPVKVFDEFGREDNMPLYVAEIEREETLEEAVEQTELHPKVMQSLTSAYSRLHQVSRAHSNNPAINLDSRLVSARDSIGQVVDAARKE